MNDTPLVSIILPSFNQGRFIKKTLESILNQTYLRIEVIVMDGGSTDGTIGILKEYGSKINWISEPDKGEYFAINKGILRAKGKYIKYSPTDDLIAPQSVALSVNYMEVHPEVAMVYGQFAYIDEEDKILEFSTQSFPFSLEAYLRGCFCHGSMTMMVRREVLNEIGLFNTDFSYTGDFELIARLSSQGFTIVYLPYILGGFRRYSQHQSARLRKIIHREALRIVLMYGSREDWCFKFASYLKMDIRTHLGKIKWATLRLFGKTRDSGKSLIFFHDLY